MSLMRTTSGDPIFAALESQGWPLDAAQRDLLCVPASILADLLALLRDDVDDVRKLDRAADGE